MEALLDGEAEVHSETVIRRRKGQGRRLPPPSAFASSVFCRPRKVGLSHSHRLARNGNRCAGKATAAIAFAGLLRLQMITVSEDLSSSPASMVDRAYVRAVEASDLDKRLRAIEEKMTK